MENKKFGNQLRFFRQQTFNSKTKKPITQQGLGELLREELGIRYSGAAVSDWERGESRINADDRFLLTSLVKILKHHGGIKTSAEANLLLEAGNYRALNTDEKNKLFTEEIGNSNPHSLVNEHSHNPSNAFSGSFFNFPVEFQKILAEAQDGPSPVWPRVIAAIMRKIGGWVEASDFTYALVWLMVWVLAHILLTPSMLWPFPNRQTAVNSIYIYIGASIALPLLVGLLTHTDKNITWKDRPGASPITIRLYTYQGAFVGFHVGYFAVFAIRLAAFYLQFGFAVWSQFLLAGLPLLMSAVGARVVPDNLWRAYKRLRLSDGWMFFIFVPLGSAWGWFFLTYYAWLIYPALGTILIVTALLLTVWRNRRKPRAGKG